MRIAGSMMSFFKGFSLFLCVFTLLAISNLSYAQSLLLCDYMPSQSQFLDLKMAGDFRSVNNPGQHNTLFSGNARLDVVYLLDTQRRGATVNGNLQFDLNDASLGALSLSPNGKYFPGNNDFFMLLGLDVQSLGTLNFRDLSLSALTGYGYGRFRDVTPFATILNVQNQLLRLGKLSEPLPDETLKHLAELIGQRAQDSSVSELVNNIQQTLERSGLILGGPLAAPSLLIIERILQDKSTSKFCGWETSLGVELQMTPAFNILGLFAFQYALAPAPRSQLILNTKWSFAPDVLGAALGTFFLDSQFSYTYRLSEFIEAQGRYTFLRSSSKGKLPIDIQSLNISLAFDLASLSLIIDLNWSLATGNFGWSRAISVNLGYEIF